MAAIIRLMIGYGILKFPWRPSRAYSSSEPRETIRQGDCYPLLYTFSTIQNACLVVFGTGVIFQGFAY